MTAAINLAIKHSVLLNGLDMISRSVPILASPATTSPATRREQGQMNQQSIEDNKGHQPAIQDRIEWNFK
jgi:hypothetical protein